MCFLAFFEYIFDVTKNIQLNAFELLLFIKDLVYRNIRFCAFDSNVTHGFDEQICACLQFLRAYDFVAH